MVGMGFSPSLTSKAQWGKGQGEGGYAVGMGFSPSLTSEAQWGKGQGEGGYAVPLSLQGSLGMVWGGGHFSSASCGKINALLAE